MTEEYPNQDPAQPEQLDQEVILSPAQQYALDALRLRKSAYDEKAKIDPLRHELLDIYTDERGRTDLTREIERLGALARADEAQATTIFHMAYDEEMGEEGEKYRSGQLSGKERADYEAERHDETMKNFIYAYDRHNIGKAIYEAETGQTPILIKNEEFETRVMKTIARSAESRKDKPETEEEKLERLERIKKGAKFLENTLLAFAASRGNQYAQMHNLFGSGASKESVDFYNRVRAMKPRERDEVALTNLRQAVPFYDDLDKQGLIPYAVKHEVRKARKNDPNRRLDLILWDAVNKRYGVNGTLAGTPWLNKLRGKKPQTKKALPEQLFSDI